VGGGICDGFSLFFGKVVNFPILKIRGEFKISNLKAFGIWYFSLKISNNFAVFEEKRQCKNMGSGEFSNFKNLW
jgi:hypothetical protein